MSPMDREAILARGEIRECKDGEWIFKQGAYSKGAYFLQAGLVKIAHQTPQGQRQLIYVYAPGEWLGYRQLFSGEPYPIEAVAIGDVKMVFIPAHEMFSLINEQPAFTRSLLEALSQEFSVWVNRLTVFSRFPVRERLAISLLYLSDRFSRSTQQKDPAIVLSRTDLADFVGATIETTVRTLSEFRANGWVKTSGRRIHLVSPLELIAELS